jgi:NAD(P)-dependent dehydrogenase (short-subunit alcohol dehydrogenase family)
MLADIPVGRMGKREEIALGASFLVPPYADYINGENLTMDGGGWLGKGFMAYQ